MKIASVFISLLVILFACRPAKKIQRTSETISNSKIDTTRLLTSSAAKTVDSAQLIKDVFDKVLKNKINFTTFNAKVKAAYKSNEGDQDATAYIRLKKDSAIWLSMRGPLGIEGFRILITKDSVKVINLLKKNVQFRSISLLHEFTGIPLDFSALQDLIVGNPVFIDSNIQSYNTDNEKHLQVLLLGSFFKNLITVDTANHKILYSNLEDINQQTRRNCNISYSNYENSSSVIFSTKRNITVETGQSNSDINLDFKQYSFNQPVTFPFTVQANYKRL